MKKNFRRIMAMALCASMVTGCGAGSSGSSSDTASSADEATSAVVESSAEAESSAESDVENEDAAEVENETTTEAETETEIEEIVEEPLVYDTSDANQSTSFTVDGDLALTDENTLYDGLGIISANNSSRLLLDYKSENPEIYQELLEYIFGEDGMGLSLIKIEMGADIDSSSGTEPAVKRSEDEEADVTRGAGYQLAADALEINPDLEVDMLYWGIPNWVATAEDSNEAFYQWYKQTIDALYDTYGIKVTYITVGQNEHSVDTELVKYVRNALDNETDARYDYSEIKIVAGEGVETWKIARKMLEDEELMDAIDVVSAHYTSWTDEYVLQLQSEYGKKVWFSEGSSPMSYSTSTYNYDGTGSGISGINGMLDIATRITTAMANGMTMYEFQPAVAAYYDGVTYFPKQLITANSPWSGGYSLDTGFYMALHFSQFIKSGWMYVDGARYGDGVAGGDGHAVVDSTFNYLTLVDENKENCSIVLINNSAETIGYTISLENLSLTSTNFNVWETRGPEDGEDYYTNFFKRLGYIDGSEGTVEIVLQPYSMVTLSTLEVEEVEYESVEMTALELPYEDDFEYSDYDDDYLASRGNAPRYTTDQTGAFEVEETEDGNVLMQQISPSIKPTAWGGSADPTTNLGDDTWSNYRVTIDVHFADDPEEDEKVNYVGLGARYNLADSYTSGYWIKLYEDGNVELIKDSTVLDTAYIDGLDTGVWHSLSLTVVENTISASVDGEEIFSYEDTENVVISGRVALYSYLQKNYYDNLKVEAVDGYDIYITRADGLDSEFTYSEGSNEDTGSGWYHNTMSSYKNYNRTLSTGYEGATVEFTFTGSCFALIGGGDECTITIEIDGEIVEDSYYIDSSKLRKAAYANYSLEEGEHTVKITVNSGELDVDAVEYQ